MARVLPRIDRFVEQHKVLLEKRPWQLCLC